MSDIGLNVVPSPELPNTAVQGLSPPRPETAASTAAVPGSNPFAALLAGVLGVTQPVASAPAPLPTGEGFPALPTDSEAADTSLLLALPGTAPAPPALPTGPPTSPPAGNGLPPTGNVLPPGEWPDAAFTPAPVAALEQTTDDVPPATEPRTRIFLADLALTRPLEPAPAPAAAPGTALPDAGVRPAAPVTLAGRALAATGRADAEPQGPMPGPDTRIPSVAVLTAGAGASVLATAGERLALRLAGVDPVRVPALPVPVAGTEFIAGQLAAFASRTDSAAAASATASSLTSGAVTDANTSLSGRFGSTGLPPLQPLGEPGAFAGGLADRLLTLGGPGAHSARLRLHPEHLGELDVEITMDDGTAQVWFGTTTVQAREVIESSLPRLKELFADQGIQLTRTQVDAGGGQTGNPAFSQERRMSGGAELWNDVAALQPTMSAAISDPARANSSAPARLLDVWA